MDALFNWMELHPVLACFGYIIIGISSTCLIYWIDNTLGYNNSPIDDIDQTMLLTLVWPLTILLVLPIAGIILIVHFVASITKYYNTKLRH